MSPLRTRTRHRTSVTDQGLLESLSQIPGILIPSRGRDMVFDGKIIGKEQNGKACPYRQSFSIILLKPKYDAQKKRFVYLAEKILDHDWLLLVSQYANSKKLNANTMNHSAIQAVLDAHVAQIEQARRAQQTPSNRQDDTPSVHRSLPHIDAPQNEFDVATDDQSRTTNVQLLPMNLRNEIATNEESDRTPRPEVSTLRALLTINRRSENTN